MYGGRSIENKKSVVYDDIYVLSLPSFTWTKVYQGSATRAGHTCHLAGNRTMITVGGFYSLNYTEGCDWESKGVGVLDMSDVTWSSVYDAYAPKYRVPDRIVSVIGGNGDGGATLTKPVNDFDQEGLAQLFNATATGDSKNTTGSKSPSSSTKDNVRRRASIFGGTVGGVVLATISGALLFYHRKRIYKSVMKSEWPFAELDGDGKVDTEIMTKSICWELPAIDKPIELSARTSNPRFKDQIHSLEFEPPPYNLHPPVTDEGIPF